MDNRVSIIIPAYNEEKNIENVIKLVQKNKKQESDEIIVVDNASTDNTNKIAKSTGVTVIECNDKGKGYAMEMGLRYAKNQIIVFLDADINNYSMDLVDVLTKPIIKDEADFVKSMFERQGGRVTELVAKPLLDILFPDLYKFSQPLSGMIAGKKSFFEKLEFEKDYGVDIGILLDMINLGARVQEVQIGKLNNDSQTWLQLEKMSREVMAAIFKRANSK